MHTPLVERARVCVGVVFAANGFAMASWLSRVPAVRDTLGLSDAQLGLLLLCLSAGAVTALPLSGGVVQRVGPARAVLAGAVAVSVALVGLAAGLGASSAAAAGVSLAVVGAGSALWDVAMNVAGADVERRLGRPIMPRFHAGFSIGTVAGAGVGAASAQLGVSAGAQVGITGVAVLGAAVVGVRGFLTVEPAAPEAGHTPIRDAWRDGRTVLIGVFVLAFALTEGVANDWLALALVDGHGASEAVGALGYGVFVTAMTLARMTGGAALARWGRVATLRVAAVVALVGLLMVVLGGPLPVVLAGAALWGVGASLGFPVGMSAAADHPVRAAARVSVVSSVGYTAFLAGPPLVGLIAESADVLRALLVVVVALLLGLATAGSIRERGHVRV